MSITTGDVVDFVVQTGAKAAASLPAGPAGVVARVGAFALKLLEGQVEKAICIKAQEALGCKHVVVCPHEVFNTRQSDMIDYVKASGGMAFVFDSVALGHPCADMDVKKISVQVLRHITVNKESSFTDYTGLPTRPCRWCASGI